MSVGSGNRQTLAADGNTDGKDVVGPITLSLSGTFGGGTAKLQRLDPEKNWVDVVNGSFTDVTDTYFEFEDTALNHVRVNIASSTTPALVVWIQGKIR